MADNIKLVLEQTRDEKLICKVTAEWFDMKDYEANLVNRDIVTAIVEKSVAWDKALTGGPPTA